MGYKIGDVVECIMASGSDLCLKEGLKYEIAAFDGDRLVLTDIQCRFAPHSWLPTRFRYLGPGPNAGVAK